MNICFLSHASLGTGFVVGSHQLAKSLVKQHHTVCHISSPASLVHLFLGGSRRKKFFYALKNRKKNQPGFDFIDFVPICLTPLGYNRLLDKLNFWLINHQIKGFVEVDQTDLVLIDQPTLHPSLSLFTRSQKIYRPTDLYADMGGDRFKYAEIEALQKVSGVISTSKLVDRHIASLTDLPRTVLPNGVDYDLFQSIQVAPDEVKKRENCVYIGAIDFRFDLDFMKHLARSNPNVTFDCYGGISILIDQDQLPSNLVFKGSIPYASVPSILQNYKCSVVPMNDHPSNEGRSPMKLYEFLAAGLPVLCRRTLSVYEEVGDAILLYSDFNEAQAKFSELLSPSRAPSPACLREIAKKHSWASKAIDVLNFSNEVTS